MKIFTLICFNLFVIIYGVSEEYQQKLMTKIVEFTDKCVEKIGATNDDIDELTAMKLPTRAKAKCVIACFYDNMGMIKNKRIDKDGIITAMDPLKSDDPELYEKIMPIFNQCVEEMIKETDKDECELAVKFSSCIQNVAKERDVDVYSLMG